MKDKLLQEEAAVKSEVLHGAPAYSNIVKALCFQYKQYGVHLNAINYGVFFIVFLFAKVKSSNRSIDFLRFALFFLRSSVKTDQSRTASPKISV
jgi:hypothetical protein